MSPQFDDSDTALGYPFKRIAILQVPVLIGLAVASTYMLIVTLTECPESGCLERAIRCRSMCTQAKEFHVDWSPWLFE